MRLQKISNLCLNKIFTSICNIFIKIQFQFHGGVLTVAGFFCGCGEDFAVEGCSVCSSEQNIMDVVWEGLDVVCKDAHATILMCCHVRE